MDLFTAKKLTELRKHNSLSQEALAEKIGVSRQAISKWERGEASPDTENLLSLSKIYSVSIDDILGDKSAEAIISDLTTKASSEEICPVENTPPTVNPEKTNADKKDERINIQTNAEKLKKVIERETADLPALGKKLLRFPFFLVAIIGFLACGLILKLWHPTWIVFITIPAYYITAIAFLQKTEKKMLLLLPVYLYAVIAFLIVGFLLNLWNPAWLVFLAIPLYYWFAATRK